jgi:pyruvate/2-oxoglutarate dehydrogenase complex dihydrolipoamide dehydrogenase (E3) component
MFVDEGGARMSSPATYEAIVIGSGQGGNPLSKAPAGAGWKTAVIERLHVGGTCVNVGCTPTKTMVASARMAYLARRAADYGVHTGGISVNMAEVRRCKQQLSQWGPALNRKHKKPRPDIRRSELLRPAVHRRENE